MTSRPNFPAIIGNPREFAVKVDLDDPLGGEWLFGKIGYVIGEHHLGEYDIGTSLRDVIGQMAWILFDAGNRSNSRFFGLPKEVLFDTIWETRYGDNDTGMEDVASDECWVKHSIEVPVDVFDQIQVLQFDEGEVSRIIWRASPYGKDMGTHEVRVPLGTTEAVFSQLSDLLEQLTEWEKSLRNR